MLNAIVTGGGICPLEPLPADWQEGQRLRIEKADDDEKPLEDIDRDFAVLTALCESSEAVDEQQFYEIVNGQKVELSPKSIYAAWIASRLQSRMGLLAETHGLGTVVTEGLFILDPVKNLRRRPDVAFVSAAKWPLDRPLPESGIGR